MQLFTYFYHVLTAPITLVTNASHHLHEEYEDLPKLTRQAMLAILCLISFLAVGAISGVASLQHNNANGLGKSSQAAPGALGKYSTSMALSIMARQQGIMTDSTQPSSALQAGIVQKAFAAHNAYYGAHPDIQDYIDDSTASAAKYMVDTIADIKKWPLDRLSNGNAMLSGSGNDTSNRLALIALRDSVRLNRRNNDFGLWYWESYPDWSYLDGMYSLGPFITLDARLGTAEISSSDGGDHIVGVAATNKTLEDMRLQFRLLWAHCYNETTRLLVHGYDASRSAPWASRVNGASGVVWGRSLGWFMMALVDTLELLSVDVVGNGAPPPPPIVLHDELLGMFQSLAPAVVSFADKDSGGWFQVVDMAGHEGNYIESSATAMFAYALLKGARLGYLSANDLTAARDAALAAHALLVREFVTEEEDGNLGWSGTVAVCSLNSSATYDVGSHAIPSSYSPLLSAVLEAFSMDGINVVLTLRGLICSTTLNSQSLPTASSVPPPSSWPRWR